MGHLGYIRFPTISGEHIVFTAEDDLWLTSRAGGRAERLTAGVAEITNARFSPDGKTLAFTGQQEGPNEVYVMPFDGGEAQRLTYDGAGARIAAWRPDGSAIIFASPAYQPMRRWTALQEVAARGGITRTLPYGPAHSIAFGPGGAVVVGRNTSEPSHWKRYRGGTAGYLWIDPNGSGDFRRLLDLNSNVSYPTWVGDRIYFISDHENIGAVYSCLPDGGDLRRHTNHQDYYARGLSSDGATLVYHAGGDLYTLEPDATSGRKVEVSLTGSRTQRGRRFVCPGRWLESWTPSQQGERVAFTTRGKAFAMSAFDGAVSQFGDPEATRYRLIAWLADGKRVVAVADRGEEPQLVVFAADGRTEARTLADLDIGHVLEMAPSPVGAQVALSNHRGDFLVVDAESGAMKRLDHTAFGREEDAMHQRGLAWSADGQWLAYAFAINPRQIAIKLARVETGETWQVTEPLRYDMQPAFDPGGKYLYFLSARDFDPVQDNLHFDMGFPKGMRPYIITLKRDERSPFTPATVMPGSETKQEAKADAKGETQGHNGSSPDGEKPEKDVKDAKSDGPKPVEIDLEGITTRAVQFPVAEGRYNRIAGIPGGAVFTSAPVEGTLNESWTSLTPASNHALDVYRFESRKQDHLSDGVSDFEVTADGKWLLYRSNERLRLMRAGEKPAEGPEAEQPGRASGWLDLDRAKVAIWPGAEWRQMYFEAWRLQREQYWNADMSGIDWLAIRDRYAPLVDRAGSRDELSDIVWEMQGELGSSHAYEFGGEYREHPHYAQGSLGCDWRFDEASERYIIARIIRGDPWSADATSPLLAPGVNVAVGDAVLAINGQRVSRERSPMRLLVNQAGNEVELLIQPAAGGEPRAVTVRALAGGDFLARYLDWVEGNRKAVHERSGGRVGYIHIPDMGPFGFAIFHRYYLQEYDYEGLIVDVRWNGGGSVSGLVLEKLMRPRLGYAFQRWSGASPYFGESPRGNLVAITDENAGSDGDIFSHAFKMLKLGPLVGKRTWGGVVGISPYIALADGSLTTQPEFSFWFRDVGWGVENYGTDPTIDVDNMPQDYARGADPQLDRALSEAMRLVDEHPVKTPEPGPRPVRGVPAPAAAAQAAQPELHG
ncbi:MAG TPA: PDZ domain-containing protein [Ktedonobacterales bacterium]|nr:PDZ domain-containing protein [Ktedonobacterales bacterium]